MSFSSNIKTELCKVEFKRECCLRAECYGAWLFSRCFTRKEAAFVTENGAVARRLLELAAAGAGVSGELTFGVSRRRKPAYRVSLPENECCAAAFLRGAFLTCGTATDPNKEYHLEFAVPHKNLANGLFTLLSEVEAFPLSPALASRKGGYVVYLKESGPIEDLLTYLGAPSAAMELMQVKMYKEVKNNINRKTNFETANMDKTYSASARQVAAIAAISDTQGLSSLPEELQELAQLRLAHPDMTLRELSGRLGLTRSGVNHRLQRLLRLGEKILEEKGVDNLL